VGTKVGAASAVATSRENEATATTPGRSSLNIDFLKFMSAQRKAERSYRFAESSLAGLLRAKSPSRRPQPAAHVMQ
jgi:hypothetical protein